MQEKIYTTKKELVIKIPLLQKRHWVYDDDEWEDENIIAVIEEQENSGLEMGFCYRIDMSYKGKSDQWTDFFYKFHGDEDEFVKLCRSIKMDIVKY